jgi:hypothetical protein
MRAGLGVNRSAHRASGRDPERQGPMRYNPSRGALTSVLDSEEDDPQALDVRGRLRIVLATLALDGPGGSQSYALTVAHELSRLGHEVTLFAEELGPVADFAERQGLRVARSSADFPPECDGVLVQDRIVSAEILSRYPEARLVHVCHSDLFDHQLPMLVSGALDAVVVLSDRVATRVGALALDVPVVRLRQPIATDWFSSGGSLPPRPRRAVLLGNYLEGSQLRTGGGFSRARRWRSSPRSPPPTSLWPRAAQPLRR